MNGTDQRQDVPLDFYRGLSYLGRPVRVALQGESPTLAEAGGTPTGVLGVGPTGAPSRATRQATGTPTGTSGLTDAQQALLALGLVKNVSSLASTGGAPPPTPGRASGLDFGPGTSLTATLPSGAAALAIGDALATPPPGLDFGPGATLSATLPEGQAAIAGATPPPPTSIIDTGPGTTLTTTLPEGQLAPKTTPPTPGLSFSDVASTGLTAANVGLGAAELAGAKVPPEVSTGVAAADVAAAAAGLIGPQGFVAAPVVIASILDAFGLFGPSPSPPLQLDPKTGMAVGNQGLLGFMYNLLRLGQQGGQR